MAIKLNLLVFSFIVAVSLVQISQAQTSHVVGGSIGWTIPPGGPIAYTTWAANQTFTVGDVLFFNYTTGAHDVATVTKAAFDGCSTTNTISTETNGPTNLTLNSAGEHYFICTFGTHCTLGQKLAVSVSSSQAQTSHVVGGSIGWTIPPGGPIAYTTWAADQTFAVGDVLFFNYTTGAHDVATVTKAAFDGCSTTNTISTETNGPTNLTLNSAGEHYFICTFGTHCTLGQKLAVNVSSSNTSSPSPLGTTTSLPPPAASSSPPLALAALPITLFSILVALRA